MIIKGEELNFKNSLEKSNTDTLLETDNKNKPASNLNDTTVIGSSSPKNSDDLIRPKNWKPSDNYIKEYSNTKDIFD